MRVEVGLVGDAGTGKSALAQQIVFGTFTQDAPPTIGVDTLKVPLEVDGTKYQLVIHDTAGQEKYGKGVLTQLRRVSAVLFVASVADASTLEAVVKWSHDLEDYAPPDAQRYLVLAKNDLEAVVSVQDAEGQCKAVNAQGPFWTSAKTGEGVRAVFEAVARGFKGTDEVAQVEDSVPPVDLAALGPGPEAPRRGCGC